MLWSFCLFLGIFLLVGSASLLKSSGTRLDYYIASRNVPSWLVGLSAVATNNSGYMFIGVMGYTYITGLASVWLMCGWIAGDLLASLKIHRALRLAAAESTEASYAGVIAHWGRSRNKAVQRFIALISLLFMLSYASAQLLAGSKALHALFDWPLWAGSVLGSAIVGLYCVAGGIRASIWTDAAQSFVMMLAMSLLLRFSIDALGGTSNVLAQMQEIEGFLDWYPRELLLPGAAGALLFSLGWLFAGFSVIGQPHIMVRFMTLKDPGDFARVRIWYYGWFSCFYVLATAVGMISRIYLANAGNFDPELALPMMAQGLLPELLVGLVLAGIFAATMSTADSLLLGCSAAITHDLLPHRIEKTWLLKLVTLAVTGLALVLALNAAQSVFDIVVMSWSAMASCFGPALVLLALGIRINERALLMAMSIGLAVALAWRQLGWHTSLYEGAPGILIGTFGGWLQRERSPEAGDACENPIA